jgi:hypothetical protein
MIYGITLFSGLSKALTSERHDFLGPGQLLSCHPADTSGNSNHLLQRLFAPHLHLTSLKFLLIACLKSSCLLRLARTVPSPVLAYGPRGTSRSHGASPNAFLRWPALYHPLQCSCCTIPGERQRDLPPVRTADLAKRAGKPYGSELRDRMSSRRCIWKSSVAEVRVS